MAERSDNEATTKRQTTKRQPSPNQNTMQLDLFEYSRDTGLRHDLLNAIEKFNLPAAQTALCVLAESFPNDIFLPDILRLMAVLQAGEHAGSSGRLQSTPARHEVLAAACARLNGIEATALQLLGANNGRIWLNQLWREAAVCATGLPFSAPHSEHHAAALYLRARDWVAAEEAVSGIVSWRRIPAPLCWMAQARYRQCGLAPTFVLLCELACLAPSRFEQLLAHLADPVMERLLKKFYAWFEGEGDALDLVWFPAFAIIEDDAVVAWLRDVQFSRNEAPEQATKTLIALWGLARRGTSAALIEQRKRLQGLHPALYARYMQTRS